MMIVIIRPSWIATLPREDPNHPFLKAWAGFRIVRLAAGKFRTGSAAYASAGKAVD
jgi:hypothetical protein